MYGWDLFKSGLCRKSIFASLVILIVVFSATSLFSQTATNIGDMVWHDVNANYIKDGGETGLSGVTVELYNVSGSILYDTDVTDGSGNYSFTRTITGSEFLRIVFTLPATYFFSKQNIGGDDDVDSDPNVLTGAATFAVTEGVNITNLDAGMFRKGTYHGHLYQDANNNSSEDSPPDSDMNGVEIAIVDKDGFTTTVYTGPPNADGDWTAEIVPGSATYDIVEATSSFFDNGYVHNEGAGLFTFTVPEGGDKDAGKDGFYLHAMVGDFVWRDDGAGGGIAMNGIQDGSEIGLPGVTIYLYNGDFSVFESAASDVNGYYEFTGVVPDTYYIDITGAPSGYAISPQDAGGDDSKDSDINGSGKTAAISVLSGSVNDEWDIGLYKLGSISNIVWFDVNGDGIQDGGGEAGIDGVTVTLYESDGTTVITTDVTSGGGLYSFTNLEPDDYVVGFTKPSGYTITTQNAGGDDALDSDPDPTSGKTVTITISEGEDDDSVDCGMTGDASISNLVWHDLDGDGVQDGGSETGIDGLTVNGCVPNESLPYRVDKNDKQ